MLTQVTFAVNLFVGPQDIDRSRKSLLALMHALQFVNMTWLMNFSKTPPLYKSGVLYRQDPPGNEIWQDIPTMLKTRFGDCEDLACWRAAELNFAGIRARPYLKWRESGPKTSQFHAVVRWPDGRIEDPSAALGMNGMPIIAQPVFVSPGPMPA